LSNSNISPIFGSVTSEAGHQTNQTGGGTRGIEALASPMRMELVGHFVYAESLSVSDLARRTGRPATSIYHHVHRLLEAGLLREVGTRPKGKRFETLYALSDPWVQADVKPDESSSLEHLLKALRAALNMAARDVEAALPRDDVEHEGPARSLWSMRAHLRASPELLSDLNAHLTAIEERLRREAAKPPAPRADDQYLSLTVVLAPLRGRMAPDPESEGDK
jgi:DNA-binding transcriptional ArsR family regulator